MLSVETIIREKLLTGPIIVACQWKRSSPMGPALHDVGGSRPKSFNSLLILLSAISLRKREMVYLESS